MSERPTPETDALEQKQSSEGCPQWNDMMRWVREHAALARKLERERDEAREQIKELIYIADRAIDLAEIDFENDKFGVVSELRSDLEKIKELNHSTQNFKK